MPTNQESIAQIPLKDLSGHPENLRRKIDDLDELTASMRELGVLEPLLVRKVDEGYQVLAGHRRLAAAAKAGLKTVPCIIRPYSDEDAIAVMLIENLMRKNLDPIEEASGFQRLVGMGMTLKALAVKVGRKEAYVRTRLGLLELPTDVIAKVKVGKYTIEQGLCLLKVKDLKDRAELAKKAPNGFTLVSMVDNYLIEKKQDKAFDKAVADLKKQGIRVVDAKSTKGDWRELRNGYDALGLNPDEVKAHAKLDCHAVFVRRDWRAETVTLIEYCTDPKVHSKGKDGKDDEPAKPSPWHMRDQVRRNEYNELAARAALVGALKTGDADDLFSELMFRIGVIRQASQLADVLQVSIPENTMVEQHLKATFDTLPRTVRRSWGQTAFYLQALDSGGQWVRGFLTDWLKEHDLYKIDADAIEMLRQYAVVTLEEFFEAMEAELSEAKEAQPEPVWPTLDQVKAQLEELLADDPAHADVTDFVEGFCETIQTRLDEYYEETEAKDQADDDKDGDDDAS